MKKLLKSKGLYLVLGIVVIAVAINGFLSRIRDFNTQVEQYTTGYDIEITNNEENYAEEYVYEPQKVVEQVEEASEEQENIVVAAEPMLIILPLQGELLAEHSGDELVYNKTLEDWRTHNGIDIAAEIGTAVKAAASGIVTKVGYDGMNGFCIEIDHGGYATKYCGLQESDIIAVDVQVQKGDIIGGVGTTIENEAAEIPHLHFELFKEGESVNPLEYIENNVL